MSKFKLYFPSVKDYIVSLEHKEKRRKYEKSENYYETDNFERKKPRVYQKVIIAIIILLLALSPGLLCTFFS